MRIAVSARSDEGVDAVVAQHFGRAPFFVFIDCDAAEVFGVEVVANPFAEGHWPGEVPQFISDQRAEVMLSGGMGMRAISLLADLGVEVATGAHGTVAEAVADYLDGRVWGAEPCLESVLDARRGRAAAGRPA